MPPRTPASTLRCVAVNVNGQRDKQKRCVFFDWMMKQKFDIVILTETHSMTDAEVQQWVQ